RGAKTWHLQGNVRAVAHRHEGHGPLQGRVAWLRTSLLTRLRPARGYSRGLHVRTALRHADVGNFRDAALRTRVPGGSYRGWMASRARRARAEGNSRGKEMSESLVSPLATSRRPRFTVSDAARLATSFGIHGTARELTSERDQNFLIEGGERPI